MAETCLERTSRRAVATAENVQSTEAGTSLAIYAVAPSCRLMPVGTAPVRCWGGARNRADRESWHLNAKQVRGLIAAAARAEELGLAFNRHWTVHYERAGIAEIDGTRFIGHLLKLASAHARRHGGAMAAAWVRENGEGKGGHVHILLHLPAGLSLRNRTRRWVALAGGTYRRRVSKVVTIRGSTPGAMAASGLYRISADNVRAYVLKGVSPDAGEAASLPRYGEGGLIVGKRCGWTQNIGADASN